MRKYRFIFVILTILCIIFIWSNSIATGTESSAFSERVMEIINNILSFFGISGLTEHFVRKLAHFSEFLILACLLVTDCIFYSKHILYAPFGGLLVALIDETIQVFSADRSSSVVDVWIDFLGLCAGTVIMLAVYALIKRKKLRSAAEGSPDT